MSDLKKLSEKEETVPRKKPLFKRTDFGRKKGLKDVWRKPRGRHNKLRLGKFNKGPRVRIGYGRKSAEKYTNKDGMTEILVHNISDLEKLNKTESAVIAGCVGLKKKYEIAKKAEELKIKIENIPTRVKKLGKKKLKEIAEKAKKEKKKKTEEKKAKEKKPAEKKDKDKSVEKKEKPVEEKPKTKKPVVTEDKKTAKKEKPAPKKETKVVEKKKNLKEKK
ncbi:MAG: hypothetical protein KAI55_00205 [Candidatus Aenigmarchaeota archaeon]|nr:hypothetical protein [Candidatus Aenigmarchaeota archaeon]